MGVNLDKPHLWKNDIATSVDMYNAWFLKFAPDTFRTTRIKTTTDVEAAFVATGNHARIEPAVIREHPGILPTLRMSTCPPLAVDRLIGLAGVADNVVKCLELEQKLPSRMAPTEVEEHLIKICGVIKRMIDPDIFVWLGRDAPPTEGEIHRAATIVADRLCGSRANPIIRNEQEKRQLAAVKAWLEARGYRELPPGNGQQFHSIPAGTFSFRLNVPITQGAGKKNIKIPVDAVIMPRTARPGDFPIFFEAKSAGDYTNPNKRRKEEATKIHQLNQSYGNRVQFNLLLCGYFDSGYLGYEAAEGIDWVWEHRIDDLALFGI